MKSLKALLGDLVETCQTNEIITLEPFILLILEDKETILESHIKHKLNKVNYPQSFQEPKFYEDNGNFITGIVSIEMEDNPEKLEEKTWKALDPVQEKLSGIDLKKRQAIFYAITEATNNVKDHSKSEKALLMFRKKDKILEVGIYDKGIGFKKSLENVKFYPKESHAIIDVFLSHKSSKTEMGRGWGIDHIRKSVLSNSTGELLIISNDGWLYSNSDTERISGELPFSVGGVCVMLRYNLL